MPEGRIRKPRNVRRPLFAAIVCLVSAVMFAWPVDLAVAQFFGPPAPVGPSGRPPPPPPPGGGGFFNFLFGGGRPYVPPPPPPPRSTRRATAQQPRDAAPPAVATVEVAPKDENAKRIVVLGDFVAGGIAWGLDQTFANEPRLSVIDRSNGNSGLARADNYDWNKKLPEIINDDRPDIIVIALGMNDRQDVRDGKLRLKLGTDEWETAYNKRIDGLVDTLKVFGRPFFWVTAPPVRATAGSRDMGYFNDLYKPRVLGGGGYFVDIWNGFTNDDGRFISSGPDVDGQLRSLRTSDGINFTRAGKLKLAFYVEREIRHQTGIGAGAVALATSASQTSQIEIGADGKKRLVGPVISLDDPLPGASSDLAGELEPVGDQRVGGEPVTEPLLATPADTDSPQYQMLIKGQSLPAVAGRADDFTWPPSYRPIAGAQALLQPPPATAADAPVTAEIATGRAAN
jgi:hypothetical protein